MCSLPPYKLDQNAILSKNLPKNPVATTTFTCFATSLEMLSKAGLRSSLFGTKQQVADIITKKSKRKTKLISFPLDVQTNLSTVKLLSGETSLQTAGKDDDNNNNDNYKATNNHRRHRNIREEQAGFVADSGSVIWLVFHVDYKFVKHRWRLDDCKYSATVSMLNWSY